VCVCVCLFFCLFVCLFVCFWCYCGVMMCGKKMCQVLCRAVANGVGRRRRRSNRLRHWCT
jgi:hypothetical protein